MSLPTTPFGDIADFRNGLNYNRQNFGTGLKVISVADFGDRRVPDYSSLGQINPEGVATDEDLLTDGDLLFVRSNGNRALVGRVLYLEAPPVGVGFSGFCIRARVHPAVANPKFCAYFFRSKVARDALSSGGTGASIQSISQGALKSVLIPLPSLEIQRQTVAVLQAYDDLIENNQRRIKLLEEAARRLYREWFVALRFPGHERVKVVDGVPQGWERVALEDLAKLNYGKALKDSVRKPGNIPVYGSSGIVGTHDSALVDGQAIIVGRKGNVGSVFLSGGPFFPIDTVYYVSPEQTSLYLFLLLQTLNFISSDSAVPGLNRSYAYSLPVLNPASDVLGNFEKVVQPFFQQIGVLSQSNVAAKQARDALLPRLMSGALAV